MKHVINHSENKSAVVFVVLQSCPEMVAKLLPHLTEPTHQQDLCEMFLLKDPLYAKIMLNTIPDLFSRMASEKLLTECRKNFEILYAEYQKSLLTDAVPEKNGAQPKKI